MHRPSSRRRSRSASRGTGDLVVGIALIALVAATGGAMAWFWFTAERPPILDKASLCPADGPRSFTVALVDASDDLPPITRREVETLLLDAAEAVPAYGLLEVRVLDPGESATRTLFSKCNPGDGTGISEFTGNPALARKRWRESFRGPVTEAVSGSLQPSSSNLSPIMGAIQRIAVERFTGHAAEALQKKLVVVSDMIENTPEYSQYSGDLSYARYKASPAYKRLGTDLHGAEVTIRYVQRLTKRPLDSAAHIQFWTQWISDNNGRLREASKLQGAGS